MNIIVYTKTGCLWSTRIMEYLRRNGISFEERDIIKNPTYRTEVEEKSGQSKSPTLDIDGIIVPDAGVEEVAAALANHAKKMSDPSRNDIWWNLADVA